MSSKTVGQVAGFVLGAILVVVGIATGNPYLIVQGATMIVTQAIVDLTAPKTPARQASEMSIQLGEQPRVLQVGETATAGSLVDGFNYGGKYGTDWEVLIIRLADHKCQSLTGFYVNDEYNAYTGDGTVGRYNDKFAIYFRSDTTTQTIASVVTDHGPGWTAADVGESGCDVVVAYKADKPDAKHPVWPGGRPRFLFVIKGALCYDPRLDSTVTGGSGSHLWEDPSTWEWSENAVICWYKFQRGVYANDDVTDQTKLLVGRGLSAEESPPEYIFAAANLCDEVVAAVHPYQQVTTSVPDIVSFGAWSVSANGAWMIRTNILNLEHWNLPARAVMGLVSTTNCEQPSVANDGTAYWTDGTHRYSAGPGGPIISTLVSGAPGTVPDATRALDSVEGLIVFSGHRSGGYILGSTYVSDTLRGRDACLDANKDVWIVLQPNGSSASFELRKITGSPDSHTFTSPVTRADENFPRICYSTAYGHFALLMDGHFLTIDSATFTMTDHGSHAADPGISDFPYNRPSRQSWWAVDTEYSLNDGALLRLINPGDWVADGGVGFAGSAYDPVGNSLMAMSGDLPLQVTFRTLDAHGGYRVAGPVYASQEYLEVEEMFAAATAGNTITREGSVELEPGQAKSIVASFTDDDILSASEVNWNQGFLSESDAEWVNTVVARYVEPSQKWNDHAAPVLRDTDDIIADGKPREASITLRLVRYQAQALRVGEINRRLGRIWGRATVKLGPRFCEIEEGDWVSWTSARHGFTKTFRVDAYGIDQKWQISLTLREISAGVYADDFDFPTDGSQIPPPPIIPEIGTPEADNWALAAVTLDSPGASVPALEITGSADDDDYAEAIIFEYWLDDGVTDPTISPDVVPWTSAGRFAPDTTKVDITSVVGAETYYAAVSYVVDGITGDRLVLGPVTLAGFGTGVRTADTTFITADDTTRKADLG